MRRELADTAIERRLLPHTGRLDGDDTGYRGVAVDPADAIDPDPLVPVPPELHQWPVYAVGKRQCVTPYYGDGLGASRRMLLRGPAAEALVEANAILSGVGRGLLVLDAFRPATVQASLWSSVFDRLAVERHGNSTLGFREWVEVGRAADDTASYCALRREERMLAEAARLSRELDEDIADLGDRVAACIEFLTYQTNHGQLEFALDEEANTAHGSGGAVDVVLIDLDTGEPTNLGVPFDSTSPAAVVDWFEHGDPEAYRALVERDVGLRSYLEGFNITPACVDSRILGEIRRERRLLFHAMCDVGATFFSLTQDVGEAWHFNLGNERGGRRAAALPGGGNACHSLLRNVRDAETGQLRAVWGNSAAHAMASQFEEQS